MGICRCLCGEQKNRERSNCIKSSPLMRVAAVQWQRSSKSATVRSQPLAISLRQPSNSPRLHRLQRIRSNPDPPRWEDRSDFRCSGGRRRLVNRSMKPEHAQARLEIVNLVTPEDVEFNTECQRYSIHVDRKPQPQRSKSGSMIDIDKSWNDDFTAFGQWWLPGKQDRIVAGRIRYVDGFIYLDLLGDFVDNTLVRLSQLCGESE